MELERAEGHMNPFNKNKKKKSAASLVKLISEGLYC